MKKEETEEAYKQKKKNIIDKRIPLDKVFLRRLIRPFARLYLKIKRKIENKHVKIIGNKNYSLPKNRSVIFVINHTNDFDFNIINEFIKEQSYLISEYFKYTLINDLFGTLYVDINDDEDIRYTNLLAKRILHDDCNLIISSESPLDFVDIALEGETLILPIDIKQDGEEFLINFGSLYDPTEVTKSVLDIPYRLLSDSALQAPIKRKMREVVYSDLHGTLAIPKQSKVEDTVIIPDEEVPVSFEIPPKEGVKVLKKTRG